MGPASRTVLTCYFRVLVDDPLAVTMREITGKTLSKCKFKIHARPTSKDDVSVMELKVFLNSLS